MLRSVVLTFALLSLLNTPDAAAEGGVYVYVGNGMVRRSAGEGMTARRLHDATVKALGKSSPWLTLSTKRRGQASRSFYVDPEVVSIERTADELRCTVSMLISTQVKLNPFAVARGTAVVTQPYRNSAGDCVAAAVDGLIDSEVVPAMRNRARMHP